MSAGAPRTEKPQCDSSPAAPGNPHGGNVEVKIVDPSANPYLASAAILGLALDGITQQGGAAAGNNGRPGQALRFGPRAAPASCDCPTSQAEAIAALDNSQLVRSILGDPAVDMVVAVRRFEHEHYADLDPEQLADKFRMAWSV